MKPWVLLLTALLVFPAAGRGDELPVRINLRMPSSPPQPGKTAQITVELLGESGRPAATSEALQIDFTGLAGLAAPRVTIPAGASHIDVAIQPAKAGLWKVEARGRGLLPGFGVVVCIAKVQKAIPATLAVPPSAHRLSPSAGATNEIRERSRVSRDAQLRLRAVPPAALRTPAPAPPPPIGNDVSILDEPAAMGGDQPPTVEAPAGRVELIAQPAKVRRTRDGWQSRVDAFWLEGDVPALRSSPLPLKLVLEEGTGQPDPDNMEIRGGQFKLEAPAKISATNVDSAVIRAFYPGGKSNPVRIEFVSSPPAKLALSGASRSFRGLTGVTSDIFVRLLDDSGLPVVAEREIPVEVAAEGPLGTRAYSARVQAGAMQAKISLDLNRPGSYTVQASAPGLAESNALVVRFALDWLLIASSLFGGILGSLTRVLYRRERVWPKGFARTVALGVAAAFLLLLLSIFGVLSVLGEALPAAKSLEKVPATSLLGALLLGFIAGLVFDKIFGRFLGERGGRGAKPPAATPKEATA